MSQHRYALNDEQWAAISDPSPVSLINASAGSGKTRSLIAKIQRILDSGEKPESICAITFTNKAANEMKERLKRLYPNIQGIQISTIHSMCVKIIKAFTRLTPLKVPFSIYDDDDQYSVMKAVAKARDIKDGIWDLISMISAYKSGKCDKLEGDYEEVYKAYQEVLIKNNACDFDDLLIYAEMCLREEECRSKFQNLWRHVLVDEFQDTSTIQYKIVTSLYNPLSTKTLFIVGDFNQCVIEGTDIGDKKVENVIVGDFVPSAIGKSKKRDQKVLNVHANNVIDRPVVTISTEKGKKLTLTSEHIVFAGYVYDITTPIYFTYLMYKKGLGYRVGTTSAHRTRGKSQPVLGFKLRLGQERADAMWLLRASKSKAEVTYYEQFYSVKYGIPTWIFYAKDHGNLGYDNSYITKLFSEIDTEKAAKTLLTDLSLFFDKPHHIPKCMNIKRRRNFSITLCGDSRGSTPFHRYSINGSEPSDIELLKSIGINTRPSKGRGYRFEGACTKLEDIYEMAERINKVLPLNIIEKALFSNLSLPFIPASHVLPGMLCFIEENGAITTDTIVDVQKYNYSGIIHDLNVHQVHNFIANGIVVHNSIYAFRGAQPSNINKFIESLKPSIRFLTYNYRSTSEIIAHANNFLQFGKPMVAKGNSVGTVSLTKFRSREDEAEQIATAIEQMGGYDETAILFRVNARTLQFEQAFARKAIPYRIVGALPFYKRRISKDLLAYLKSAVNRSDLESMVRIINTPKRGFGEVKQERLMLEGYDYLLKMAEEMPAIHAFDELLNDIAVMRPLEAVNEVVFRTGYRSLLKEESDITMLDAFLDVASGFDTVTDLILASMAIERESKHGVQLMTAHASKGLEFDKVFVVGVEEGVWPHSLAEDVLEEFRLYYVAITRARKYLNISYSASQMHRGKMLSSFPSVLFNRSVEYLADKK